MHKSRIIILTIALLAYNLFSSCQNDWFTLQTTSTPLRAVVFPTTKVGFAVGGFSPYSDAICYDCARRSSRILKTENLGRSWKYQTSPTDNALRAVSFLNQDYGIAVGDSGIVIKTTNGGNAWGVCLLGDTAACHGVFVIDSLISLIVADSGKIFRSIDGGKDWIKIQSGYSKNLLTISFPQNNVGFIGGEDGLILKSIDGGNTWKPTISNTSYAIHSLQFVGANVGFACSGFDFASMPVYNKKNRDPKCAAILKTTDGGENWTVIEEGKYSLFNSLTFLNTQIGYCCGMNIFDIDGEGENTSWHFQKYILVTKNGGKDWDECDFNTYESVHHIQLNSLCRVDSSIAFLVGDGLISVNNKDLIDNDAYPEDDRKYYEMSGNEFDNDFPEWDTKSKVHFYCAFVKGINAFDNEEIHYTVRLAISTWHCTVDLFFDSLDVTANGENVKLDRLGLPAKSLDKKGEYDWRKIIQIYDITKEQLVALANASSIQMKLNLKVDYEEGSKTIMTTLRSNDDNLSHFKKFMEKYIK